MENPKTLTPDEQAEKLLAEMRAEHQKRKAEDRKLDKTFNGAGTEKRGAA